MGASRRTVARGIVAGVAVLALFLTVVLAQTGVASVAALAALAVVGAVALVAAGPSALRELATAEGWWLAGLEPALEDAWNRWSDLVLAVGLGIVGFGSFAAVAVYPGEDPPLGLVVVGFLALNCALIAAGFAIDGVY